MEDLKRKLRRFTEERDWEQFHSPKNLAMALSVEVAEINEIFQWMTEEESQNIEGEKRQHLEEEIGDVMNYLVSLGEKFCIDPVKAAKKKIRINEKKYPVSLARGSAKKYVKFQDSSG